MRLIYNTLKALGFVETRWQLVFVGQIGALVIPHNHGVNEIHVRFYNDRIYAELEFSRSSILHFLCPFYNASDYVVDLLRGQVPNDCVEFLVRETRHNLRDDELSQPPWNKHSDPYENIDIQGYIVPKGIGALAHRLLSWRKLMAVAAVCFSIPYFLFGSPEMDYSAVVVVAMAAMLGCARFVPTIGRP